MYNDQILTVVKVMFAMALGGAIGWEREAFDKSAGLRTHMFISGAAALFMFLSDFVVNIFEQSSTASIRSDPIRVIEAIIVGISFVGGGMIIRREKEGVVQNLTTASSMLFTTGIGIAVAIDKFFLALSLTVITVIVNHGLFFWKEKNIRE